VQDRAPLLFRITFYCTHALVSWSLEQLTGTGYGDSNSCRVYYGELTYDSTVQISRLQTQKKAKFAELSEFRFD